MSLGWWPGSTSEPWGPVATQRGGIMTVVRVTSLSSKTLGHREHTRQAGSVLLVVANLVKC